MTAVAERPVVRGLQEPRIKVVPDGDEHPRWREIEEWLESLGINLDPWQRMVLWTSLLRRGDQWAAFAVAVCAPRQNGKNGILECRELIGPTILDEPLLIHSAHLADTSKEGFRRLDDLIDGNKDLSSQVKHIWRTNGHEAIEFTNRNRIRFRTRTRGGGRGFSGSPVIFDEAMFLPEVSMGSILPVISAQPDPQIWYMGSAVDKEIHEDGSVFARVRERALQGSDPRLAYFEWSLDAESPDDVEPSQALDPESWAVSNPALGIRIMPDYIEAEYRELDDRTFAVERLGVGDWPDADTVYSVLDLEVWDSLQAPAADLAVPVLAFDVSPLRDRAAIVRAGRREDDTIDLEVLQHDKGTGWVLDELEKHASDLTAEVVCDQLSPAAALMPDLKSRRINLVAVNTQDYARACGTMFDLVDQRGIRHRGTPELRSAIKGAATRPLGDAWAWSRKNSGVDISPLVAATLAVWVAHTSSGGAAMMLDWSEVAA